LVEQALVDHVGRGELLDLAEGEVVDEAAMRSWGGSRTCQATVIRDILRGRLVADPDPHGVRLRGARISGRLDLENLATDVNLELSDCLLEEGVLAPQARMASIGMRGCRLEHPAEPALDATGLACSALDLSGATIVGYAAGEGGGAVRLPGARIGIHLVCSGASLRNDSGPALVADGLQVAHNMYLSDGFTATGRSDDGAVCLGGAHIGGRLSFYRANLRNGSGPALVADDLEVGRGMYLTGGFTAIGVDKLGTVGLAGAHIGGLLNCDEAQLRNDAGPALDAHALQVRPGHVPAREVQRRRQ
jgi:hypothetical protein